MANVVIWDGSATFTTSSTPFGFYDTDTDFQTDAVKVAKFCGTRLGYPLMDVELQDQNFFTCFEEAVTTYGNEVFQYKIRENYLNLEGAQTGSNLNNRLIEPTLNRVVNISKNYATEAGVNGLVTRHTGSLAVTASKQDYDMDAWATDQGIEGGIEIRRIFYEAPPAILRYFDPYAGTGTGTQSLMDAFDFGSFSPGVNFLMMPISYDLAKVQAIELNDQVRKSSYSFELVNNKLRIFPKPRARYRLLFEYFKKDDKNNAFTNQSKGMVTNVAEVPYNNPIYSQINSVGRQWIFRYTLALAKELLGYVRGKYQTVPVPGSEATLNQADLLNDSRTEREKLMTELKEMLEQTSRQSQLERKANESENLRKTLTDVPYTIYIG
jgi:hypothetical protein|tara:strand:- start:14606 stop:15748 length:1143 start_codon:yes stop_codon:yes gene_type:complete